MSPPTKARRTARVTARANTSISGIPMPSVLGRPSIVVAAESPMKMRSTPARSANAAMG